MRLIGGILMPDKSQNLVDVRWLLHLVKFNKYGKLSWGLSSCPHYTRRCVRPRYRI
ncbi:hypothetical protein Gotur_015424 [Gossypium turneri]